MTIREDWETPDTGLPAHIDPTTGEMRDAHRGTLPGCPRCDTLEDARQAALADLSNAERELRALRRRVGSLEAELKQQRQDAPEAQTVRSLYAYWVEKTNRNPNRTKLSDKREKVCLARLREGYAYHDMRRAIDGAVIGAYVNPQTGQRYDDMELIFRDGVNVERFRDLAFRQDPQPEDGLDV